ncbi:tRNA (adenosine(37)-N6)-threonylcarbamoyltransferase complex ATPase subunit type 1 TsaE [Virgibacillus xinjiangensis]|uniref:tRNA threonylcarbamoyladenosine biosynthesis protein TsaE n=1 Tax=Virgibacillus xinjiangensis TaxID=393090 RepID=A0ABV7CYY5_9BACI
MTEKVQTNTDLETIQLAVRLASLLKPGDVLTLEGDLGAGKTTFTKGIAEGLGIERTVSSPTFTIVKEYEGEIPLYHMDVYRLEGSEEDIGLDEYLHGDGVSIIEWPQFIDDILPEERLAIKINYVDENIRTLEFTPRGKHYNRVVRELLRAGV